jgi:hypothetical protein
MSSWLTEQDFRKTQEKITAFPGLTLNVAFLQDIKQDTEKPEEIIGEIRSLLSQGADVKPAELVSQLGRLRDELETYFALEEFYGYFQSAKLTYPRVSNRAERLQTQHETLYLDLCQLIEQAERTLYGESVLEKSLPDIVTGFHAFVQSFNLHEQEEFDLMMKLCNDDLGVGD